MKKTQSTNGVLIKPFYKRPWFWIILVVLGLGFVMVMGSEDEGPTSKTTESTTEEVQQKTEFKKDETVSLQDVEFKVDDIQYLTDEYISPKKQYVAVKVTIKNNSDEGFDFNSYDFKLDADGVSSDMDEMIMGHDEIENDKLHSGTLKPKAKTSGWLIGEADKNTKQLKLEYTGNLFDSEAKFSIILK